MRIHLYSRKYEKALGIQCFLLYTGIIRRPEGGVYEFKLKMDDIHDTLGIFILLILFVAYGVYLYFT